MSFDTADGMYLVAISVATGSYTISMGLGLSTIDAATPILSLLLALALLIAFEAFSDWRNPSEAV
ncbi:hypothetical protein GWK26_11885 [haloarchaeon 3A1-DGR]|nr:hypothetical protein GWK26_11885 [haloarchaeon 3A1-DGR]